MVGRIRIGIGGWSYEPWRGTFYPPGLPVSRELAHAAGHLTAIEINGTYHGPQKPETFARWRREVPQDFVFEANAVRSVTDCLGHLPGELGSVLLHEQGSQRVAPERFAADRRSGGQ